MAYMPYNDYKGDTMTEFEVIFYEKENGDCPVEEFITALDVKMRAKMVGLLELLEEKGNQLREPYSKPIDDGIFEIRCKVGNNITRVLYFFTMKQKLPGSQKSADFPYQALKCFLNLTDSLCGNYRSFPAKCF